MKTIQNLKNTCWNLDCIDFLPELPDESIDLICIDPPYLINYQGYAWDKKELNWDFLRFQFNRILKSTGNLLVFQGWSNVCETKASLDVSFTLRNWIIWDRVKGRGGKYNLTSTREDILWYSKTDNYTFNKTYSTIPKKTKGMGLKNGQPNRSLSNVFTDVSPLVPWSAEKVKHPVQKPLQLIERLLTVFSNEGDLVLDCFAGSFTTAVSAKRLNRDFICVEKDTNYFQIGQERLQRYEQEKQVV